MINGKTVFDTLINGRRIYEFATYDKFFFPYMPMVIHRFYVYQTFQKRRKGFIRCSRFISPYFLQCKLHYKKRCFKKRKKVLAFPTSSKPFQIVYYILIHHSIKLHIYPQISLLQGFIIDVFPIRSLFASFFEPSRFHFLPFIQSRRTHDGCFVKPNPSLIGD